MYVRPGAERQIAEQYAWIWSDSPVAAEIFLVRVRETMELIAEYPLIGKAWPYKGIVRPGLRYTHVREDSNRFLVYRHTKRRLTVVALLHAARDLGGPGLLDEGSRSERSA